MLEIKVARREFEEFVMVDILNTVQETVQSAIRQYKGQSKDKYADIEEVILVGGSSVIPCVREAIRKALHCECIHSFSASSATPKEFCTSLDPYHTVAQGLAIRGAILSGVDTVSIIIFCL